MLALIKKHPVILLLGGIIVALLTWGFWPQPIMVEAVAARYAPLTITIEEEGRTRVIDRYLIAAPVGGVTCRVELDVGDPVERGQVLLGITPLTSQVLDSRSRAQAQANIEAARSAQRAAEENLRAAQAAEQLAATELMRIQTLLKQGAVSRDAYDQAQTRANTTTANRRSAEFNVDVARYELTAAKSVFEYDNSEHSAERVPVVSPIDGRILKVEHECAGPVNTGDPLLEVGDPAALEVEVDVLSADAVRIRPGMHVMFERWGGDQPLEGRVRLIEPVGFTKLSALGVEEQRVLVISDFTSPAEHWQRLGDGYRVMAKFVLWHDDEVLQVPASSLFRVNGGWAVFVVKNGRAMLRELKVGERNGLVARVLEGLDEGERVINHPSDAVAEGVPVITKSI